MTDRRIRILHDVYDERERQERKFGEQHHPDGTSENYAGVANLSRDLCQEAVETDSLTWRHILDEEFSESVGEHDKKKLRQELVEVAAVAVAWVEDIDSRP